MTREGLFTILDKENCRKEFLDNSGISEDSLDSFLQECPDFTTFLGNAFLWEDTPEKEEYWFNIYFKYKV